ncbi:ribokinase [Virgisporangium aliadipatigenens]|uniref:Ribokinase n=1 Tax=Virgisporangium aliadipatigenens TaxID=741659 RepID=A0A8J4DU00_9ACTN|nr:PfkB family carbohydrate kinase [Virgisporangium aliadipatigenens]GIJ50289.1 ribokinase [Virgisporangium aliadipatigenens]
MAIYVVGSINADLTTVVPHRPTGGETVLASELRRSPGGKGANQAVAAARAGGRVTMIGAVGADDLGRAQLAALDAAGVRTGPVAVLDDAPTGLAFIVLTPDGENSIVVVPGANRRLDGALSALRDNLREGDVVVAQAEIGPAAVDAAATAAATRGARLVVSDAPVVPLAPATLAAADPLIVNEHEAHDLLGGPLPEGSTLAAAVLRATGARSVVVTLGGAGCVVVTGDTVETVVPGEPADVVDTTGAGDVFVGTLAAAVAAGADLLAAALAGNRAAARSVGVAGARG